MLTDYEKKIAGILPWDLSGPGERGEVNWYDLSMNHNSFPHTTDTAIIVTSHPGHRKYLKATLTNYRLTGKWVIGAYDTSLYAWGLGPIEAILPTSQVWILAHSWVFKHLTYDCNKRNGWFWSVRYAQGLVRQFDNIKYVWTVNGDCLWEKPENVDQMVDLLGDGDMMSQASNGATPHTCSVIYKVESFHKIFDAMLSKVRVPVIGSRSPEVNLREALEETGLKETLAPVQPDDPEGGIDYYSRYGQPSTWKEILGFRNLDAEIETACRERLPIIPAEYIDLYADGLYLNGHERETLFHYYQTKDRRWLEMYYDQGRDSDYDREFHPLEHYGKEPIYEEAK
jgi:hypothetical protein